MLPTPTPSTTSPAPISSTSPNGIPSSMAAFSWFSATLSAWAAEAFVASPNSSRYSKTPDASTP